VGIRAVIVAAALGLAPTLAAADRGALTLELGPAVSGLAASPSQGAGSTTLGTGAGGTAGIRYAISNSFELAAIGFWEAPVDYFHSGVEMGTATGTVRGTFSERTQRYGGLAGVRFIHGYVWRLHLGADVGWAHESYTRRDLIDVSTPGNEHSFGLGLRDHATDALVLAPVAGIEWQFTDHWTVSIMPRLQYVVGGVNRLGLLVPVSVGYSLYFF
jgi:hypothetical protein